MRGDNSTTNLFSNKISTFLDKISQMSQKLFKTVKEQKNKHFILKKNQITRNEDIASNKDIILPNFISEPRILSQILRMLPFTKTV